MARGGTKAALRSLQTQVILGFLGSHLFLGLQKQHLNILKLKELYRLFQPQLSTFSHHLLFLQCFSAREGHQALAYLHLDKHNPMQSTEVNNSSACKQRERTIKPESTTGTFQISVNIKAGEIKQRNTNGAASEGTLGKLGTLTARHGRAAGLKPGFYRSPSPSRPGFPNGPSEDSGEQDGSSAAGAQSQRAGGADPPAEPRGAAPPERPRRAPRTAPALRGIPGAPRPLRDRASRSRPEALPRAGGPQGLARADRAGVLRAVLPRRAALPGPRPPSPAAAAAAAPPEAARGACREL